MSLLLLSLPALARNVDLGTDVVPGSAVLFASAFYDPGTGKITVSGTAPGVGQNQVGQYRVHVQGTTVTPYWGGAEAEWSADVLMDVTNPPATYPYPDAYQDPSWMDKPLIVELTNSNASRLYARERVWVSDERTDDSVTFSSSLFPISLGGSVQLTPAGLDALESAWLSIVPWPYEAVYDDDVWAILEQEDTQYAFFDVCAPIDEHPDLKASNAYIDAYALAVLQYASYVGLVSAGQAAAADALCVRKAPPLYPDAYEVCVAEASGTFVDNETQSVQLADLEVANGVIETFQQLKDISASVDVELADVRIRWSEGQPCAPRPSAAIDFATETDPAVLDWKDCPAREIGADWGEPGEPDELEVGVAKSDAWLLDVASRAAPTFLLAGTYTKAGSGTCGESFISGEIETLLLDFLPPLEAALGQGWEPAPSFPIDSADHGGAAATDRMLEVWEQEPECDARCQFHAPEVRFTDAGVSSGGVFAAWEFQDVPFSGNELWGVKGHIPTYAPYSAAGEDPMNQSFHVMTAISTVELSQILTSQSYEHLNFDPADEWTDLGVNPTAFGLPADSPVVWNGDTLGAWHSTFRALRNHEVSFGITPTIAAWTWMPLDPNLPSGQYPVHLSLPQLELSIVEGNSVWLTAVVDFHDSDLQVDWGYEGFAEVSFGAPIMFLTIVESQFDTWCPRVAHINMPANVSTACEREMEAALHELIEPQVQQRVLHMLSEVPFPQTWDFGNNVIPLDYVETLRWQHEQYIALYAEFI